MSCGCGGGRDTPYHPSDSYHFQGGGGIASPPAFDPGDGVPIVQTGPGPDESMAQPDRAPSAAADVSFPWGWAIVAALAWFMVRRAG
jgi:hypothetical protein